MSAPPPGDFELETACRRVIRGALGVVPGEVVVLIVDEARLDLGMALDAAIRAVAATPVLVQIETLGARPLAGVPASLRAALGGAQASVLLIDIGRYPEHPLRRQLVDLVPELGLRHAHLIGMTRRSLVSGMSADPARVAEACRRTRGRIRPSSRLVARSAAGTHLTVQLSPEYRWKEFAGVIREGRWENLPSGLLIGHATDVSGTYVADATIMSSHGGTEGPLGARPVSIAIEGGQVRSVRCPDHGLGGWVERQLAREPYLDRVGAVLLGTNVGLSEPIGDVLHDQCVPGLHLVFGYSHPDDTGARFTARGILTASASHLDVDLDGAALVRQGRLL